MYQFLSYCVCVCVCVCVCACARARVRVCARVRTDPIFKMNNTEVSCDRVDSTFVPF